MKVTVKRKSAAIPVVITTEFIKLEAAMKLSSAFSGGTAKQIIQGGQVSVNGQVCTMRGKKLYPGDSFAFDGQTYCIENHGAV